MRSRAATRAASSECPPRSKKSSSGPAEASSRTSAYAPATISSRASRGVRPAVAAAPAKSGAGSARRSTLPLAVSGKASRTTTADGTMCAGSRSPTAARSPAASGAGSPAPVT